MSIASTADWPDDFVLSLVVAHPELTPVLDKHQKSSDPLLSHLFLADVVRFLEATYCDANDRPANVALIKAIMTTIGEHFVGSATMVDELIATSFLENLPYPHGDAAAIVVMLPDNLMLELAIQRSAREGK